MGRKAVFGGGGGKRHRLFAGEQELCIEDLDIREVPDVEEDTTNTCSLGGEAEIGMTHLEGSFNYTWDVAVNHWNTPLDLSVGALHNDSKIYTHSSSGAGNQDGPLFQFNLLVRQHENNMPVSGKVSGRIEFRSTGTFTTPSTNDSSGA